MRRLALLIALAVLPVPAAAQAQAPPLRATLSACQSGPETTDRSATFTGSMPAIKGTRRMAMRFDLLERVPPDEDFEAIEVPGLGVWHKSSPGRQSGFVFKQRVQGLVAPAEYRAVVRFRWYGKAGRLLRSTKRETAACVQDGAATLKPSMKTGIHPEYVEAHVRCTCGNEFTTRSTQPEIHVEICSNCHPFYTGRQKLVDTGGRVERFKRRAAKRSARS
jgi:large subunit ribosomal protein L31